jgi:hypothetical protein
MKISGRQSLLLLLLLVFLFLGILFRSYFLDYLVRPVAILVWYIWRILTSVDQAIYWGILVFSALTYTFISIILRRLRGLAPLEPTPSSGSNATLENVRYWRTTILVTQDEIEKSNILKRDLGKMLAAMLASKQAGTSNWQVYNALKLHQIPLSEPIYAFLFPDESSGPRRNIKQILKNIWQTPRSWIRRWTHRDVMEYYQSIDQVIAFMESSMEIQYDAKPINTLNH